jgi:hypothetical protein
MKYKLTQKDEFTYKLKVNYNPKLIYILLKSFVKNAIFDSSSQSILFSAEEVKPLQDYLLNLKKSHAMCIKMIDDLIQQINYLKSKNYCLYGFDIQDVLVINTNLFVICSGEYIISLSDNSQIIFYNPIKFPYFGNPDLITLTNLPGSIHYSCIFYSLGALIIFCLFNEYLLVGNEIKSEEEIEKIIMPLQDTKIYWFLKRCLKTNVEKRVLLLI